jgi:hypothetical protein
LKEHDELAAVLALTHLRQNLDVDGQFPNPLSNPVEKRRIDALPSGRIVVFVFNADRDLPSGSVGEAHAVLGQLNEIGPLPAEADGPE